MYKIKVKYSTGNSFGSYEEEEILEIEWQSLDLAKKNLQYIKEHYDMTESISNYLKSNDPKLDQYRDKIWFNAEDYVYTMKFELDNGNTMQILVPWIGYFECLESAEIITDNSDLKIEF